MELMEHESLEVPATPFSDHVNKVLVDCILVSLHMVDLLLLNVIFIGDSLPNYSNKVWRPFSWN